VLKDASAYSIYGVRGANGVIVVTTKKGKTAKARVDYSFYLGYQVPLKNGFNI
jgi:TonB-dependent SusC/RagA subfamily outer membrane receptor